MKRIINVPTIRDDNSGYEQILSIASEITNAPKKHFDFDFSHCSKLEHNGVVILGALARFVDYQNTRTNRTIANMFNTTTLSSAGVMFRVDTMNSLILQQLQTNNFLSHFSSSYHSGYPKGDYIGYREHNSNMDDDNIANHLGNEWLSSEKLSISPKLKPYIVSRIFEIFMNAYGHGTSIQPIEKLGVYSCGQYDKKEKKLNLSVLDFGLGIVKNVRNYLENDSMDSLEAFNWALLRGNSTGTDNQGIEMPRGLGLDLLKEFIRLNKGELRIYSNDVFAVCGEEGMWKVTKCKKPFLGTFVSIKINCDDDHYCFASEASPSSSSYF
ncbi:hypothetical protein [Alteromonas lipotrueae]|uniref:hypothetical protein n=1 Tax=Alteromonas lipotrueae TaxID=2803814 RepID=UPI001C43DFF5|nr:hypothetical protein [Alteromonas lipotrueae]